MRVDDPREAATTISSNMHERVDDFCPLLSPKLKPVTFKQVLPSTGPLRGSNPRIKAEAEYMNVTLLLEKSWPLLETSKATCPAFCAGLRQRTSEEASRMAGVIMLPNLQVATPVLDK